MEGTAPRSRVRYREDILRLLKHVFAQKPNFGLYENHDWPLLTHAVRLSAEQAALEMLKAGADVNIQDWYGDTPLANLAWPIGCQGAREKRFNFAKMLFDFGADPFIVNYDGQSAFDLAKESDSKCLRNALHGYKRPDPAKKPKSKELHHQRQDLNISSSDHDDNNMEGFVRPKRTDRRK